MTSRGRNLRLGAVAAFAACTALSAVVRGAPPTKAAPPAAPEPPPSLGEAVVVESTWRQILMAPRVTGNLRAVAVDPSDPKNVFVGTEEGTIIHSTNGGVTWDEIELSPFTLESPSPGIGMGGDDYSAIGPFGGFNVPLGTGYYPFPALNRRGAGKGPGVASPPLINLPPWFVYPVRLGYGLQEPLLGTMATGQPKAYEEIQQIIVCPKGDFSVFALTTRKLWGSPDGISFVPLYYAREDAPFHRVTCSPINPNEVVITSVDGTFRSTDSGASFDQIGSIGSNFATFSPPVNGQSALYLSIGREIWYGDATNADAMRSFPVAGEGDITWIYAAESSIWVSTETGVLVSRDHGKTWKSIEDLEGFEWTMLAVAPGAAEGKEHVVVLGPELTYLTTDGGEVFRPYFRAESRRHLRQVVSAPSPSGQDLFMLLTSGELWSTVAPERAETDAVTPDIRRWAERRLRTMPKPYDALQAALAKARLTDVQIDDLYGSLKARGWLPGVNLSAVSTDINTLSRQEATLSNPQGVVALNGQRAWGAFADLVWELPDLVTPSYGFTPVRQNLYSLRKQFEFVIEDAYDERKQVLAQMLAGGLDVEQVLTLKARVDVLDALLIALGADQPPR